MDFEVGDIVNQAASWWASLHDHHDADVKEAQPTINSMYKSGRITFLRADNGIETCPFFPPKAF
jgi:hypothetical protein